MKIGEIWSASKISQALSTGLSSTRLRSGHEEHQVLDERSSQDSTFVIQGLQDDSVELQISGRSKNAAERGVPERQVGDVEGNGGRA